MINNTSLQKWDRLKQKQLDQMFTQRLLTGLNCSPFEATAILDLVYDVYKPFFDNPQNLQPGQMIVQAISVDSNPGRKLSECSLTSVTLTIDAGEKDIEIRKGHGVIGLRRYRIQRICDEAFQQGALLTVEDIANRILNCGERTICRDIEAFKKEGITLPLRSIIKDIGRSLTHRTQIIKEWLKGKEYLQISQVTKHSLTSVQNYVEKFKRVACLVDLNYEINAIAFLVKISAKLAEEYVKVYRNAHMIGHRRDELNELIKKNR
jgi:hypothetical protein